MIPSDLLPHEKKVDRLDALAGTVITLGGGATILSVLLMVVFIVKEIYPLLLRPEIAKRGEWAAPGKKSPASALAIGVDEYRETAFRLVEDGGVEFLDLKRGTLLPAIPHPELGDRKITASAAMLKRHVIVFGTQTGDVGYLDVKFDPLYSSDGGRIIAHEVAHGPLWRLDEEGGALVRVAGAMAEEGESLVIAGVNEKNGLFILFFDRGEEESVIVRPDKGGAEITALALKESGETLAVGTRAGDVWIYALEDKEVRLEEKFHASEFAVSALAFLIGDESLILGDQGGGVVQWLPTRHVFIKNNGAEMASLGEDGPLAPGEELKLIDKGFHEIKMRNPNLAIRGAGTLFLKARSFASQENGVEGIAASPRNKGFLTVSKEARVAYHHGTTGRTYATLDLESGIARLAFAPKSDGFLVLREDGMLNHYTMEEQHPDVTAGVLFTSVWYEGYPGPALTWQSTGGTDDFEPKFSMWPLIFGTLKGTFYAMLFAVPISILGAVYLSRMAPPGLRDVVKPVIEIMAAIPSVVVGFLAGLWLSPLMSSHLTSFFLILLSIPAAWFFMVGVWWVLPARMRPDLKEKYELLYLLPFLLLGVAAASQMGPWVERVFLGGDIKEWLYSDFGLLYDPRNCLVVGFAMGFAIIPIIFTISEDALTAVPESLTSAAFALAASKWQTALYVVLPAASPGIFAAIMLGLGRAVGETMIVLMATGNTPIMDASIFNGLRAMSATIAVEMPEAPQGSSLYRLLFLTGILLFAFTFTINTLAGAMSRRLKRKYSRF